MSDKQSPRWWQTDLIWFIVLNGVVAGLLFVVWLLGYSLPAITSLAITNIVLAAVLIKRRRKELSRVWQAGRHHKKD